MPLKILHTCAKVYNIQHALSVSMLEIFKAVSTKKAVFSDVALYRLV
jgi:hypothetical protein